MADALSRKSETLAYVRVQIPEIEDIEKDYVNDEDFGWPIWNEVQDMTQF